MIFAAALLLTAPMNTDALEEMGWEELSRGIESSQYGVRLASMIGSYLTKDVRAVPVLIRMMRDPNAVIRTIAIQMASDYQDAPLKDEVARLLAEEKVWMVRLEVIRAAGFLRLRAEEPRLRAILESDATTMEEKMAATEALLAMRDTWDVKSLAKSNRAGLRFLACSIAERFQKDDPVLLELMQDSHEAVRISAINLFGLYYRTKVKDPMRYLEAALNDTNPKVAITAAWAALLIDPKHEALARFCQDTYAENRRLAAAAVVAAGDRGVRIAKLALKESTDPYVRANCALALLNQRVDVEAASDALANFLEEEKRLVMTDRRANPLFSVLNQSEVRHNDQIPNYPEAHDQMTRLQIVSLLSLVEDPRAIPCLKEFLTQRKWGITGAAAAMLLKEGDESAAELVRQLVHDKDPNVRLQACLVLALLGKDDASLLELQASYAQADHEKKLHILEAVGRVGNATSYEFLLGALKEPFPMLRIAAAAALIQSVNR